MNKYAEELRKVGRKVWRASQTATGRPRAVLWSLNFCTDRKSRTCRCFGSSARASAAYAVDAASDALDAEKAKQVQMILRRLEL